MKFIVDAAVYSADLIKKETIIELKSSFLNDTLSRIKLDKCYAYRPFINSHDHLIGNWYPPARDNDLYPNAHIWVNEMKDSHSVRERDQIFMNTLPMDFMRGRGRLLALLGAYKNIFSGVTVVQDHAPKQKKSYYSLFPIEVIRNYRQCHSLTLGNFWGDDDPVKEWEDTEGKEPFIVHLGEGLDQETKQEFSQLKEMQLLQPNTLLIHGISLSVDEIRECAEVGASICWCPFSNINLIGKTLDIDSCLKYGVNVVIGTDSTLSGSINLFNEIQFIHNKFPHLDLERIYQMISKNAARALYLNDYDYELSENSNDSLILINGRKPDPLENLMSIDYNDVILLVHKGLPLYGYRVFLNYFDINDEDYFFYPSEHIERFVIGHPEIIMQEINKILGYKKELPFLPF